MAVDQLSKKCPDGTTLGQGATDLVAFYGATPIVQPTNADQTALTDSSGGTKNAATGVSANAQKETIVIPIGLLTGLANGQTWKIALPYAFTVTAALIRTGVPVTTGAKAATLTVQVNGVAVTGGVISATSAGLTPTGATQAATAITAGNTGTAGQTLEVAVSAVTAFLEGSAQIELTVINTDKANQISTVAAWINQARTALVNLGLIKGS